MKRPAKQWFDAIYLSNTEQYIKNSSVSWFGRIQSNSKYKKKSFKGKQVAVSS